MSNSPRRSSRLNPNSSNISLSEQETSSLSSDSGKGRVGSDQGTVSTGSGNSNNISSNNLNNPDLL